MKITSGIYRGRELASPKNQVTHPMGSRERLALFNALQPYLKDAAVLDAYAGTGALGLEALSRGAAHATFIEKDRRALTALRQNIANFGADHNIAIVATPVENFTSGTKFNLIFADPPYDKINLPALARLADFLAPDGIFILSHPASVDPAQFATDAHLRLHSTKIYAVCHITIFEK